VASRSGKRLCRPATSARNQPARAQAIRLPPASRHSGLVPPEALGYTPAPGRRP
jgi:hypothetical protein